MIILALIGYVTVGFYVGAWLRAWAADHPEINADVDTISKLCIVVWPALFIFLVFYVGMGLITDLQEAASKKMSRKK
jgi:purine-cytosine permease-like protein